MNPGQKMFHDFVVERVQPGTQPQAEAILADCFKAQDDGTFTVEQLDTAIAQLGQMVRPECQDEFHRASGHMRGQMSHHAAERPHADTTLQFCQSCGLPFDAQHEDMRANEADGTKSPYCTDCYKDGQFLQPDATVEDMIEVGVPHLAVKIGEDEARKQLTAFVPTLDRWK